MAMAVESLCHKDPNFAVICNFWDRYGELIGLKEISYSDVERWLEDTKQVPTPLIDLHVRLLRRIGKTSVTANRWERYIIKFCYTYSEVDAWEMEKFGYKHCKLATKLKLLKNLLEKQFDQNSTFKEKINKLAPEDMRFEPIGRDKNGLAYWYMLDNECNLRVYREDLDDNDAETWEIVCKTRNDLAELVGDLEKQIKNGSEVKTEPSSGSNSVKSEVVDDEKKIETSDDSQDSLPEVKKDPEKTKEEKLDEVDGVVDKKENDEKKDKSIKKEESEEKQDLKTEHIDEEKDLKNVDNEKTDNTTDTGDTKQINLESIKSEPVEEKEKNSEEKAKNKMENSDGDNAGVVDCKIKNESHEKEKCEVTSGVGDSVEDSSLEQSNSKKEDKLEKSNKESLLDSSKKNSQMTDDGVKGENLDSKSDSENKDSKESIKSETVKEEINDKDKLSKISSDSPQKHEIDSEKLSENSDCTGDSYKTNANSDTVISTSVNSGAKCDTDNTNSESTENTKCGCDNNEQTKGDNQGNKTEISDVNNDTDDKLETNLRKSSRVRTSRTRSQDSRLKDDKDENKLTDSVTTEECVEKDSSQTLCNDDLEKENNKTPVKTKSKVKGKKRPLLFEDNSTEDSPTVEPESKKSKPAKKVLTKKTPTKVKSSSDDTDDSDDIPLSQIKGTPKSTGKNTPNRKPKTTPKSKKGKKGEPTPTRKSSRPVKKKKFDSDEEEEETLPKSKKAKGKTESIAKKTKPESDDEDTPLKTLKKSQEVSEEEEEEEDEDNNGRRRSSRVKKLMKAKKKESSPPLSSFDEDEVDDDDHSDFNADTDLDDSDEEYETTPIGRNAQRQAAIHDEQEKTEEIPNDTPCLHCHKTDRPEWLLLCDKCDDGYHTACLRPPLMIIPDGDWFCPPCEHKGLLEKLQSSLKELDIIMKKKDRLIKRKERLAYVGISLDNILKDEQKENVKPDDYEQYSEEEEEEPEYYKPKKSSQKSFVKRSCRSRNVISYKFDDFDDMINTAIKEDLENPKPYNPGKGRSRGKDMANIYMAEGREYVSEEEGKPSPVGGGKKKKKGRRLTNLDDDEGDDDEDSGEEYKCSDDSVSEPPEEEEDDDEDVSDYSVDGEGWRKRGTRRSARRNKTSRRYRDFVVDEEEDSDFAPRRKSARAARATTRQRRKYKDVWTDEEEEELEEESNESVDTEDLCSEDSGPTKLKKNRKEIDKKVFKKKNHKKDKHGAKRRRMGDSEEESEGSDKSSGDGEESESKSETDDSSIDMGKIKKAAKRKLSKRRNSKSSSESEKSESSGPANRKRNTAKKVNYKAIAGSDSEETEESEEGSESDEDVKSKKKNVIRDESSDTDDYHEKKSETSQSDGETTEEDEKEPVRPKKPKKGENEEEKVKKYAEEEKEGTGEGDKPESEILNEQVKDDDKNTKPETESSISESIPKPQESDIKSDPATSTQLENTQQNLTTAENPSPNLQPSDNAGPNSGVIRPSPQYSMGQNIPEGNYPPHQGQAFHGHPTPYGSPPQQQYMSSPPHQPFPNPQMGGMMPPGQPHSQGFPPQMMQRSFPVSSSGVPMSTNQGSISSPPFQQMQQRPQYTSGGPLSQNLPQMYGRFPQGQPMMPHQHPDHHEANVMQKGPRPDMPGHMRSPYPNQPEGQMFRGPHPGPQQMMRGPYPKRQDMMMMQNRHPNFQPNQMMRGPNPSQQTQGHMIRGPYPTANQQDPPRVQQPAQETKGPQPDQKDNEVKSPDSTVPKHSAFEHRQSRGSMPFPRHIQRPMLRSPLQRPQDGQSLRGPESMFRPGFPYPDHQMPSSHPNDPGFMNKPGVQTQNMAPHLSNQKVSSSSIINSSQAFINRPPQPIGQMIPSQMAGPRISSPPVMDPHHQAFSVNPALQVSQMGGPNMGRPEISSPPVQTFANRATHPGLQMSQMSGQNIVTPEISSPPVQTIQKRPTNPGSQTPQIPSQSINRPEISSPSVMTSQANDKTSIQPNTQTVHSTSKDDEQLSIKSSDQNTKNPKEEKPLITKKDAPEIQSTAETKNIKEESVYKGSQEKQAEISAVKKVSDTNEKVKEKHTTDMDDKLQDENITDTDEKVKVRQVTSIGEKIPDKCISDSDDKDKEDKVSETDEKVKEKNCQNKESDVTPTENKRFDGETVAKLLSEKEERDVRKIDSPVHQDITSKEQPESNPGPVLTKVPSSEALHQLPQNSSVSKENANNIPDPISSRATSLERPHHMQHSGQNVQSAPTTNHSDEQLVQGPPMRQSESSIVSGPHPYQQGMFRGQFNEMMSHMGQNNPQRMMYQQGGMPMRPNMQGPQNFYGQGPQNYMPRMGPDGMGHMPQHFQRPMYGPGPMPYSQSQRLPSAYGPGQRPEMRMPHNFPQEDPRSLDMNRTKGQDISSDQNPTVTEPTKAKKPRKPRQSKKEKEKQQAEAKTMPPTGPNYPGYPQQPSVRGPNPQFQMPMSGPMNPQQGQFMRPPLDNYGMNGMNQGQPEFNQMNPGMYGPPQMIPANGGRGFMIDNLLDKQPRVQQLEPIISQDEDEENSVENEQPQTYEEEPSPSNGEKDMDEMSDIGDIVKYVMNH